MDEWVAPGVAWGACATDPGTMPEMECASLAVPVDWTRLSGPAIELKLARSKARRLSNRKDIVLALSGGPWGSAAWAPEASMLAYVLVTSGRGHDQLMIVGVPAELRSR